MRLRDVLRGRAVFLAWLGVIFLGLGLYGEWLGLEPYWHPFTTNGPGYVPPGR